MGCCFSDLTLFFIFDSLSPYKFENNFYLHLQVSPYTGRVHMYTCVLGTDIRPRPLHKNFRPEELELLDSLSDDIKKKEIMGGNPAFTNALLGFLNEWKQLRPIERKKLLGKPLQLPLTVELCYLSETNSHDKKVCITRMPLFFCCFFHLNLFYL